MRKITFTLLFLFIGTLAFSQVLWEGTRQGMSVEQVRSLFPSAITPNNPGILDNGARELLRVNTPLRMRFEYPFNASFYFVNNGLTQVTLFLFYTREDVLFIVEDIFTTLTERHGNPVSSERDINIWEAVWTSGRTRIVLHWSSTVGIFLMYSAQ